MDIVIIHTKLKKEKTIETELCSMLFKKNKKNDVPRIVKTIEPKAPDTVLFGLRIVNLGPPNNFPTTYPPISEKIQDINILITHKFLMKVISA